MHNPKISFVIPSHNSAAWVPHAVESALGQKYKNIEVVVVNDASTDTTQEYFDYLERSCVGNLKLITNATNKGRSESRNIGNKAATGDVICVLDADDICTPERASIVAQKFKEGCQFLHGKAVYSDAVGKVLGETSPGPVTKEMLTEKPYHSHIVHSSVAYLREFAEKYPYSAGAPDKLGFDDWDQHVRMLIDGVRLDFTPAPLVIYRMLDTGITATGNRSEADVIKAKQDILAKMGALSAGR